MAVKLYVMVVYILLILGLLTLFELIAAEWFIVALITFFPFFVYASRQKDKEIALRHRAMKNAEHFAWVYGNKRKWKQAREAKL